MGALSTNDYLNRTVRLEDLTDALVVAYDGKMSENEAKEIARTILSYFGFSDVILDNIIEDARDMFYMLEASEILKTDREKTTLYNGREWRIFYWILNKEKIFVDGTSSKERLGKNEIKLLKLIQATNYKSFIYFQLGVMDSEGNLSSKAKEVENILNKLKNLGILDEHKENGDVRYSITPKYFQFVKTYISEFIPHANDGFASDAENIKKLEVILKENNFNITQSKLEELIARGVLYVSPEDEKKEKEKQLTKRVNYFKNRLDEIYNLYQRERSEIKQKMMELVRYSKQIRKIRRNLAPHLKEVLSNKELREEIKEMEEYVREAKNNELSTLENNLRVDIKPYPNGVICVEYLNTLKERMNVLAEWEKAYHEFDSEYTRVKDGYQMAISIGKNIAKKLGVGIDD
ncbi:MAG: hypothetical protein J7K73_04185 [Nanoarchaeota archaeon]|nr:hypothetical protein [Nanoarchaeota archaeon]